MPWGSSIAVPQSGQVTRGISESEQALKLAPVEPHDDLVVHGDDGHRHPSRLRDELGAGCLIIRDVLRRERHAFLRKKLFRRVTRLSGRGPVDRYQPVAHRHAFPIKPPKIRRARLNASPTVAPEPAAPGFAARHARKSSSDRKKFSCVQSDVAIRRWSSRRASTHTMSPSASGPGLSGVTENAIGSPL